MAFVAERRLSVEYLYVAVFTTVTIMLWVGLELVRSLTTPASIPQVSKEELEPLSTELQVSTVNRLKGRTQIPQATLDAFEPVVQAVSIAPVTHASESARIEETSQVKEATTSGGF